MGEPDDITLCNMDSASTKNKNDEKRVINLEDRPVRSEERNILMGEEIIIARVEYYVLEETEMDGRDTVVSNRGKFVYQVEYGDSNFLVTARKTVRKGSKADKDKVSMLEDLRMFPNRKLIGYLMGDPVFLSANTEMRLDWVSWWENVERNTLSASVSSASEKEFVFASRKSREDTEVLPDSRGSSKEVGEEGDRALDLTRTGSVSRDSVSTEGAAALPAAVVEAVYSQDSIEYDDDPAVKLARRILDRYNSDGTPPSREESLELERRVRVSEEKEIALARRVVGRARRRAVVSDSESIEDKGLHRSKASPWVISSDDEEMDSCTDNTSFRMKLRKRKDFFKYGEEDIDEEEVEDGHDDKRKRQMRKGSSKSPSLPNLSTWKEVVDSEGEGPTQPRKEIVIERKAIERKTKTGDYWKTEEVSEDKLKSMDALAVAAYGKACAWEIDEGRKRSSNLQGAISGRIKKRLEMIDAAFDVLSSKSMVTGDPSHLLVEIEKLKKDIGTLRSENRDLTDGITELEKFRDKIMAGSKKKQKKVVEDDEQVAGSSGLCGLDFPSLPPLPPPLPQRPSLMGKSKVLTDKRMADEERESIVFQQMEALNKLNLERKEKQKKKEVVTGAGKSRIVSDVLLAHPQTPVDVPEGVDRPEEGEWFVVRRNRGKVAGKVPVVDKAKDVGKDKVEEKKEGAQKRNVVAPLSEKQRQQQVLRRRMTKTPKTAAVTITGRGGEFSYANALKQVRERVSLDELGIVDTKIKRALNGGILIEIPGEEAASKASALVGKIRDVLQDTATVVRPVKNTEMRIFGLDDSITAEEIKDLVARDGGCDAEDVRVGTIRTMRDGLGSVWVKAPTTAAAKIGITGKMRIGWTVALVEILESRPLQCHKCWCYGHIQGVCRAKMDRSRTCYNCGCEGHLARGCTAQARCVLCVEAGQDGRHRTGGRWCKAKDLRGGNRVSVRVRQGGVNVDIKTDGQTDVRTDGQTDVGIDVGMDCDGTDVRTDRRLDDGRTDVLEVVDMDIAAGYSDEDED